MAAISGVRISATNAPTTAAKAVPMTTATARSTTLPRRRKALNSLSMRSRPFRSGPERATIPRGSGAWRAGAGRTRQRVRLGAGAGAPPLQRAAEVVADHDDVAAPEPPVDGGPGPALAAGEPRERARPGHPQQRVGAADELPVDDDLRHRAGPAEAGRQLRERTLRVADAVPVEHGLRVHAGRARRPIHGDDGRRHAIRLLRPPRARARAV